MVTIMKQRLTSSIIYGKRMTLGMMLIAMLTSCAAFTTATTPRAYQIITPGTTLTLKRELSIAPGQAGVIIQGNQLGNYNEINAWYPNCRIELRTVKEIPQSVSPDTFTVQRVTRETDYVSSNAVMLAYNDPPSTGHPNQRQHALPAGNMMVSNLFGNDGGPMAAIYRTYLYVQSSAQPDVMRFMCEHWEDPSDGEHLTVEQIKQALGDFVEINIR